LSVCFHSCRCAEFDVTLLSSDGKWLGIASKHAMMHAISLTLSSLYFICILGSYAENFWRLEACFRVVSHVESAKLDFYDQYKDLVLSVCPLRVSKCLLDLDLEMKLFSSMAKLVD
jgi:hypothetical protein